MRDATNLFPSERRRSIWHCFCDSARGRDVRKRGLRPTSSLSTGSATHVVCNGAQQARGQEGISMFNRACSSPCCYSIRPGDLGTRQALCSENCWQGSGTLVWQAERNCVWFLLTRMVKKTKGEKERAKWRKHIFPSFIAPLHYTHTHIQIHARQFCFVRHLCF